jgi:hypothetical protein
MYVYNWLLGSTDNNNKLILGIRDFLLIPLIESFDAPPLIFFYWGAKQDKKKLKAALTDTTRIRIEFTA